MLLTAAAMTRSVTRHSHETLQRLKEAEELVVRPIARGVSLAWDGLCQRLFFHGERRFEVDLSGFHRLMAKPQGDDGAVDARLEQVEGHRVTQDMHGDALVFQRRAADGRCRAMSGQQVLHAIRTQLTPRALG